MGDERTCPYCQVALDGDGRCPSCGRVFVDAGVGQAGMGYAPGVSPSSGVHTVMPESFLPRTDAPDITQSHRLPVHTVLKGRYLVERVLGEGGFGITYEGFDQVLEKRIAVKEYFPSGHATRNCTRSLQVTDAAGGADGSFARGKERFMNEARSMARVGSQGALVGVSDFFEEFGTAYIVMDYVEGKSLKEVLRDRGGRMPFSELMDLLLPIMGALGAMHEAGLVHRDISPDNIMVGPNGATLIDFGCAREFASDDGSVQMMTVMLKYDYAAPEQYTRGGQGPWTDVYGMCAVIYHAATGDLVPRAPDRFNGEEIVPPSKRGVDISRPAERALLRGLNLKATDRQQTMAELAEGLSATSGLGRPAPAVVATAVAGLLVCVIAAVVLLGGRGGATQAPEPAGADVASVPREPMRPERIGLEGEDTDVDEPEVDEAEDKRPSAGRPATSTSADGTQGGGGQAAVPSGTLGRQTVFYDREHAFAAGGNHTLVISPDGSVRAKGSNEYGKCETGAFDGVVAVCAGTNHSVGLRADGTVVAVGENVYGQCEVDGWTNIVAVSAGMGHTLALGDDGIVRAAGSGELGQRQVGLWSNVKAISCGFEHSLALLSDKTCVACGKNKDGRCDVGDWKDVVAIAAGGISSYGLLGDGTVVCTGDGWYGQLGCDGWSDIVAISAGAGHVVGLRSDGTCVACGLNDRGQCEVGTWSDVVAISCGDYHTVALLADGSLVACGLNDDGQCDLTGWLVADELEK